MTTTADAPTAQVFLAPTHVVTAECSVCGLFVEQVPGGDVQELLRTFRTHHPMTAASPHTRLVPDGWRIPWSVPGSWSN